MDSLRRGTKALATAAAVCFLSSASYAQLSEGFEVVTTLAPPSTNGTIITSASGNWLGALRSNPLGTSGIFQGNTTVFPAHSGPATSYMGMNFNNTSGVGTINTWAMTPELTFQNGDTVSFYTRTALDTIWPDRLELRLSTAGGSTNVGAGANDVGDFTTLLVSVNPNLTVVGYPQVWTEFTATVSGLAGPTNGRLAFRYTVPNGGPSGSNSNYIGVDTFVYTPIPEPVGASVLAMGSMLILGRRRRA